jgi:hypothetical protein
MEGSEVVGWGYVKDAANQDLLVGGERDVRRRVDGGVLDADGLKRGRGYCCVECHIGLCVSCKLAVRGRRCRVSLGEDGTEQIGVDEWSGSQRHRKMQIIKIYEVEPPLVLSPFMVSAAGDRYPWRHRLKTGSARSMRIATHAAIFSSRTIGNPSFFEIIA